MSKKPLTDVAIRALKPVPGKRLEVPDGGCPGLILRVGETGKMSWTIPYRVAGRGEGGKRGPMKRMGLGSYPMVSLADARQAARTVLDAADRGDDPAAARQAEARAKASREFEAVVGRFVTMYAKPNQKNWRETERLLRLNAVPAWRGRPLDNIGRADVGDLLDSLIEEDDEGNVKVSAARETRKHLSKLFAWAVDRGLIPHSPMSGMRRPDLAYATRSRVLSREELQAIWTAAGELGYPFGTHIRLLLLTGQRRGEIAEMKRSWVRPDFSAIEIPAEFYKTKIPHVVPLSPLAQEIMKEVMRLNHEGDYLLSTTNGKRPISGFSDAKEAIDKICKVPDWILHDLRRSLRTHLPGMKVSGEIGERILGHKLAGVAGIYDRYSYFDEKREALEKWAALWK